MMLKEAIQHLDEVLGDTSRVWECEECKQEHEQLREWLNELSELKKAQEPRVMTLEEVIKAIKREQELFTERHRVRCGIAHFCSASDESCKIGFLLSQDGKFYTQWWWIHYKNYNKTWRCWTLPPTDAQREAEPWEG